MKKNYLKPDAEYITFYSEEAITAELDIEDYADGDVVGGSVAAGTNPFPE